MPLLLGKRVENLKEPKMSERPHWCTTDAEYLEWLQDGLTAHRRVIHDANALDYSRECARRVAADVSTKIAKLKGDKDD